MDFAQAGEQVLAHLTVRGSEVAGNDDRIYVMPVRPYRATSSVIEDVVITFEDITVRKRAEQTIGQSEQGFRPLFEMSSHSIVMLDPGTRRFVESTRIVYTHIGYTRDELATSVEMIIGHESDVFRTRHETRHGEIRDVEADASVAFIGASRFLLQTWHDLTSAGAGG